MCCSNHAPASELSLSRADLYAGGVDSLTVRIVLSYVSQFDSWCGCSIDIKTAFLHAPVHQGDHATPLIVVKPPHLLIQMGLVGHNHRWLVRKALYGLQTSPRDWSTYRDQQSRRVKVGSPVKATLCQSITDENLWLLKGDMGVVFVLVIVYVDDMALFGEKAHVGALVKEIQALWKTSPPSWPDDSGPMMFCGMEIWRIPQGWKVTQRRYLQELLHRFQVKGTATSPMSRWVEPEPENASVETVREAQALTGALLWSVTRTRPDLAFTVSKMSQYATKSPSQVLEWGLQALRYASTVMDLGLEFKLNPGPWFGQEGQLALPRDGSAIEMYSDASHAVNGGRSSQCIIASWRGCLLVWEASRQPFVTLSSAEAELIAMVGALQVAESVAPVLEELLQKDLKTSLLGDNMAALTSFNQSSGSWRNRHLRMRARAGRERVEAGLLVVSHVPGALQVADVGTKPLPVGKLLDLLSIIGVRAPSGDSSALAAKFFGRACTKGAELLSQAGKLSPRTVLATVMLANLPKSQAASLAKSHLVSLVVSDLLVTAEAQPGDYYHEGPGE